MKPTDEELIEARMASLCAKCVYGFPESIGHSCSIMPGKLCFAVVTRCEAFGPKRERRKKVEE